MAFRFVNNNRNIDSETPSCVHMLTFFNIFLILGQDISFYLCQIPQDLP
jgi:hypothetical protein